MIKGLPALNGVVLSRIAHQDEPRSEFLREGNQAVRLPRRQQSRFINKPDRSASFRLHLFTDEQLRHGLRVFKAVLPQDLVRGHPPGRERQHLVVSPFDAALDFLQYSRLAHARIAGNARDEIL